MYEDLSIQEVLGKGAFGTVSKVLYEGNEFAVKTLEFQSDASSDECLATNIGDVLTMAYMEFVHETRIMQYVETWLRSLPLWCSYALLFNYCSVYQSVTACVNNITTVLAIIRMLFSCMESASTRYQ